MSVALGRPSGSYDLDEGNTRRSLAAHQNSRRGEAGMSKAAKRGTSHRITRVSFTKSVIKYFSIQAEGMEIDCSQGPPPPGHGKLPWCELGDSWIAKALREAQGENDPYLFKLLVRHLLATIDIYTPPPGVFTPFPKKGTPGRRASSSNEKLYETWESMGCPSMTELARRVYAGSYTRANGIERRKLRERCEKSVIRAMERRARDNDRQVAELQLLAKAGLAKG